jgi:pyridoxal phosphate enzyme (YggS family)
VGEVEALAAVRGRISDAAIAAGRDPADVRLLLAVKHVEAERIRTVLARGERLLGHNRAQELTAVEPLLAGLEHETHFIGRLQSNKVGAVVRWVTCVQSVDSLGLAQRLDRAAATAARVLDVMVQVNTSGEASKAGTSPAEAADVAAAVGRLDQLRLCGFMTIGANSADPDVVRRSYERLATVREEVLGSGAPGTHEAHELSMGMSGDLEVAIAAGATMVRVGSAVFGARPT